MPYIYRKVQKTVYHIGHLDGRDGTAAGLNGPAIAVSTDPDRWRRMHGLNGPQHELYSGSAEWYDASAMDVRDQAEFIEWMLLMRYMEPVDAWGADWFDDDTGDFHSKVFESREDAASAAGTSLAEEELADGRNEARTTHVDTYKLRPRAIKRLGGWPDPLAWHDAAVILYIREVVLPKRPMVVGIWWDDEWDAQEKRGPHGLLFPERVQGFEVEDEEGEVRSFLEAFPDFHLHKMEAGLPEQLSDLVERMRADEEKLILDGVDPGRAARIVAANFWDQKQ